MSRLEKRAHFDGTVIIESRKRESPLANKLNANSLHSNPWYDNDHNLFMHFVAVRCCCCSLLLLFSVCLQWFQRSFYLKVFFALFRSAVKRNGTQHHCYRHRIVCMNVRCSLVCHCFHSSSWMHWISLHWQIAMAMIFATILHMSSTIVRLRSVKFVISVLYAGFGMHKHLLLLLGEKWSSKWAS